MKYFCDAVRLGGITPAAKVNFVTQSAISQGIAKLEESLECSLLAHHPNCFRITPEGQKAFEDLSAILRSTLQLHDSLAREEILGTLSFACTYSFALSVIPSFLKRFRDAYPHVRVDFHCLSKPDDIKQMVRNGQIDFGIVPSVGDFTGLKEESLYKGHYGLYTSPDAPKNLGFILPEPEDTALFKQAYEQKYGRAPHLFLQAKSWEVIASLSEEGLGIGYFPDYLVLRKKRLLKAVETDLILPTYQISAIYPQGMKLRKSSLLFLSYFQ